MGSGNRIVDAPRLDKGFDLSAGGKQDLYTYDKGWKTQRPKG